MQINSVLIATLMSAYVNAIPLNINLGAYSPALVVGDGEISFKGKEDVSDLMNALEGAAVEGAAKSHAAGGAPPPQGSPIAEVSGLGDPEPAPQVSALQGMGKHIAPRVVPLVKRDNDARSLQGFNAALNYAVETLNKGPAVEMSTGSGGSGVGVKVTPSGGGAPKVAVGGAPKAAGGGAPQAAGGGAGGGGNGAGAGGNRGTGKAVIGRRSDHADLKPKTTVTTMFIRGRPNLNATTTLEAGEVLEKRATPSLDGVSLNVAEGQLAELTFVETRSADDVDKDEE